MSPPKICECECMYVQVCVGMYVFRWAGMHTACKGQRLTFCVVPQEPPHLCCTLSRWEPCTPDSATLAGQQASGVRLVSVSQPWDHMQRHHVRPPKWVLEKKTSSSCYTTSIHHLNSPPSPSTNLSDLGQDSNFDSDRMLKL